ncbi:MAG: PAS domain S-box protein [Desulfobacterales bacterium]
MNNTEDDPGKNGFPSKTFAFSDQPELLRIVTENILDLVSLTDPEGNIEFASQSHEIFGYDPEFLAGKNVMDLVHPEDLPRVQEAYNELILPGNPRRIEYRVRCRDGSCLWVETRGTALRDKNNNVKGIVFSSRDITEQKRSEEALLQSENYYRAIFETSGSAMFIIEEDTTISNINSNFEKMLGYSRHEIEGKKSWTEFVHPDDVAWMKKNHYLRRIDPDAAPFNYEFRFFARSGELRHGHLTVDMIAGTAQSVFSLIDITESKKIENALRESEERFRTVLENLPGEIFVHDLSGQILIVNDQACKNTGYSRDELLQMSVWEIDPCAASRKDQERLWHQLEIGQSATIESIHIRKDNTQYPVEIHLTGTILDGQSAILPVAFDITERKQAETEREKLKAQLAQAQKMESVGRLAGGVAHDFNNMLSIINGYAEITIEMLDPGDPARENIEEIYNAGTRSAGIVRQLLAFARQQTISPMHLDLNDTISDMLKMLQRLIGEDIELALHPGNNLWPVKIDPSQVHQVLANLAVNARDAISDVGKLTIETKNVICDEDYCKNYAYFIPGQYVMVAVTDNGCGMEQQIKENLFEPFFTTKDIGKGTGLGLSTIYGIVKQNEGFINVYSEPGIGTTFKIYLPCCQAQQSAPAYAREPTEQLPAGYETILLVEDEPAILKMGKDMLNRLGYTVLGADRPQDALQLAEKYEDSIDLLITDVVMPEMNGRDLSDELTARNPGLKTLFMSGYTADTIAHHGVLNSGVYFIEKPFTIEDLAVKVRRIFEQQ